MNSALGGLQSGDSTVTFVSQGNTLASVRPQSCALADFQGDARGNLRPGP